LLCEFCKTINHTKFQCLIFNVASTPQVGTFMLVLLTSQLTPWSRVLFEKPIVTQLVKKFPALYRTWTFITVFTRTRKIRGPVWHFVTSFFFTVGSC